MSNSIRMVWSPRSSTRMISSNWNNNTPTRAAVSGSDVQSASMISLRSARFKAEKHVGQILVAIGGRQFWNEHLREFFGLLEYGAGNLFQQRLIAYPRLSEPDRHVGTQFRRQPFHYYSSYRAVQTGHYK